jgi:hypothetical protein
MCTYVYEQARALLAESRVPGQLRISPEAQPYKDSRNEINAALLPHALRQACL